MDYDAYVAEYCSPAIYQSVETLVGGLAANAETLALNAISAARLPGDCASGVIGQLSKVVQPKSSMIFKLQYYGLVSSWAQQPAGHLTPEQFGALRQSVGEALYNLLDDVKDPNLSGSLLMALAAMRINLLDEIATRVNVANPDLGNPNRAWHLQEYALCVGDPGAPERIARLFAASDPQTLRRIFEASAGLAQSRKSYCPNRSALKDLVAPYLQDTRLTQDVNGNGPPVSHYARRLVSVL